MALANAEEFTLGREEVLAQTARQREDVNRQLREAVDNPELTAELQSQLELLKQIEAAQLDGLASDYEAASRAIRETNFEMQQQLFQSQQTLRQEQSSGLRALGLDYQHNRLTVNLPSLNKVKTLALKCSVLTDQKLKVSTPVF